MSYVSYDPEHRNHHNLPVHPSEEMDRKSSRILHAGVHVSPCSATLLGCSRGFLHQLEPRAAAHN
eukprot:4239895-Amphidinium_carterae.1